jgi:hypothetical protein
MHKNATKCNETLSKWCKNKHGASKIMDTLETYQASAVHQRGKKSQAKKQRKAHKTSKYRKRNLPSKALAAFRYSTHSLPKATNFFIKFCPENRT